MKNIIKLKKPAMKKFISVLMIFAMVISSAPELFTGISSFAAPGDPPVVTKIERTNVKMGTDTFKIVISISGSNLQTANVYLDKGDNSLYLATPTTKAEDMIEIQIFNANTPQSNSSFLGLFTGKIRVGANTYDTSVLNFPLISSVEDPFVNTSQTDSLILKGSNLDKISDTGSGYKALYGASGTYTNLPYGGTSSPTRLVYANPEVSAGYGLQTINISRDFRDSSNAIDVKVMDIYQNIFSFVDSLKLRNLSMNPTQGSAGDYLTITADTIAGSLSDYAVYLRKTETILSSYSEELRATNMELKDNKLIVKLPTILELGQYHVYLTKKTSLGITAEQAVGTTGEAGSPPPTVFTVIDVSKKPSIQTVTPNTMTDSGGDTTVQGSYLIYPSVSGLTGTISAPNITFGNNNYDLIAEFSTAGLIYQEKNVTSLKRTLNVQVGGTSSFTGLYTFGGGDSGYDTIGVKVGAITIDTGKTSVVKEMVMTINTEIIVDMGGGTKKTYTISESASKQDAITFVKSSYVPTVTKVEPPMIQVSNKAPVDGKVTLQNDITMSIEGSNFYVERYNIGAIIKRKMPNIYFNAGNQSQAFDVGFFPNVADSNLSDQLIGEIRTDSSTTTEGGLPGTILKEGGVPLQFTMVVLNDSGKVVTGDENNMLGTKILITIPKGTKVPENWAVTGNKINVEVHNPKKLSPTMGLSAMKQSCLSFVKLNDIDFIKISSVTPDTVSINGGEELIIKGSNFKDSVKVYIDGTLVESKLEVDGESSGVAQIRVLKTPKLRSGKLQLLVMNESGAQDVWMLDAIQPFTVIPKITSFEPTKGIPETLVSIRGENFFKPIRSQKTSAENEIYRYIGTRVYFDGKDVNSYNTDINNRIKLIDYTSTSPVLTNEGVLSEFADALILKKTITDMDAYTLTRESSGEILLYNGGPASYIIKSVGGALKAYPQSGTGTVMNLTVSNNGIKLESPVEGEPAIELKFFTPYKVDSGNNIVGKKVRVISTGQIFFNVPNLGNAGSGYVNLAVINPDMKKDEKTGNQGFYYIPQAADHPEITSINPNSGSVSGGYYVDVIGINFKENIKVYVDGILVPNADVTRANDEKSLKVKIPKCTKDLKKDYNTNRLEVPFTVLNENGGSATIPFFYVTPVTQPFIKSVEPNTGTTNGNQVIRLRGSGFTFAEPYTDSNGNGKWDSGEPYRDLDNNASYTNLLKSIPTEAIKPLNQSILYYTNYYDSPVFPQVYFGSKKAKIIEFSENSIVVLSPSNKSGAVPVYVLNNDFGRSNEVTFRYSSSTPKLTKIEPPKGSRTGGEIKFFQGSGFAISEVFGYTAASSAATDPEYNAPVALPSIKVPVRFGDLDNLKPNEKVDKGIDNSGIIFNGNSSVVVEGGLIVDYTNDDLADKGKLNVHLQEGGKIYSGSFKNFNSLSAEGVYIPMGMLKATDGQYYMPSDYVKKNPTEFEPYEYVKVYINDLNLLKVERGYAPKTVFDNSVQLKVTTPSYYTIGKVKVYVKNSDGGTATGDFLYTNPASRPGIFKIIPSTTSPDGTYKMVETSVKSPLDIEIIGKDFRDNPSVTVNGKKVEVISTGTRVITAAEGGDGGEYDVIFAKVPAGVDSDIDEKYAIIIENEDGGMASSVTPILTGGGIGTPIYFIYRKPLSGPTITSVTPKEVSAFGGSRITVSGKDFRVGLKVLISDSAVKGTTPTTGGSGSSQVEIKNFTLDSKGTTISFDLPAGLKAGKKTIQIVNSDFGTGTLENAFTLISYPQTTSITDTKKSPVKSISNVGGDKIIINGTDFDKGAKVIFSLPDSRSKKEFTKEELVNSPLTSKTDNIGMWKDSNYYIISNGVPSTEVKFISDKSLEVTVPAFDSEKEVIITVINGDGGISDSNLRLKYGPPIPTAPQNLKARIIANKNIELYDYEMNGADNVAIYYYIGTKTQADLISNSYKDFKYYGTTDKLQYKINDLAGFENKGYSDNINFAVKPVNKFGYSEYSNIATINYTQLYQVPSLGEPDYDGKTGVPSGKSYVVQSKGDDVTLAVSSNTVKTVSANMKNYSHITNRQILIPGNRVTYDSSKIGFEFDDFAMSVSPKSFNTTTYKNIAKGEYPYAIASDMEISVTDEAMIQGVLPKTKKMINRPRSIGFSAANNTKKSAVAALNTGATLTFKYNPARATKGESNIGLYQYSSTGDKWIKVAAKLDKAKNRVVYAAKKPGIFVLLADR